MTVDGTRLLACILVVQAVHVIVIVALAMAWRRR